MADFDAARENLRAFADLAERPLTEVQASALALRKHVTVIVAPRQSGKSRSLAVVALHQAFRRGGTRVLIVSAGEEAAKRLLADIRSIVTGSPLLRGSVVDETAGLLTLTNGSEVRSVPASERQIRGWTVDLLLIDEASLVPDDLILGAAFPTTAARPNARIVMAGSALAASGAFFDHVQLARQGSEHIEAFAWALADAEWISPSVVQAARESMTPTRFAAEYEGVFASGADTLFPRALLDRVTAPFVMPGLAGLGPHAGMAGVDWGVTVDRCALVAVSRALRPEGLFVVSAAHAWPSGERLDGPGGVVGQIGELRADFEHITAEVNGVGYPLAQSLERCLSQRRPRPEFSMVHTTSDMKGATYGALRMLFEQSRLVISEDASDLLRELLLLRVTLTQTGERIEAGVGHDDLADALMLAAGPFQDRDGRWMSRLASAVERAPTPQSGEFECETVETGDGLVMPRFPTWHEIGTWRQWGATTERWMDAEEPPVVRRGELILRGEHYIDKPAPRSWGAQ